MRKAYTAYLSSAWNQILHTFSDLRVSDLGLEVRAFLEHRACPFVERRSFRIAARIIASMLSIELKELDAELQELAPAKEHTLEQRLQR